MNKRFIIKITIFICVCVIYTLLAACTQTNGQQLSFSEDKIDFDEALNNDYTGNESAAVGGIDAFNLRFLENMENIYYAELIMGEKVVQEWVDNIYLKLPEKEMNDTPALYRIIHDMNIPKEKLISLSNEFADTEMYSMYIEPHIIEALYEDDISEMKRKLVNERALFYDGEIYTWTQISGAAISEKNLDKLGIPKQVLLDFANEKLEEFEKWQEEWLGYQVEIDVVQ